MQFDLTAPGYCGVSRYAVTPDGKEHTIILEPALEASISGTVSDAAGQPIPQFHIVFSSATTNHFTGEIAPSSSLMPDWVNYAGGEYRRSYTGSNDKNGYMLKFEAEGYTPFLSRVIFRSEGNVKMNVTLSKANIVTVSVVLPDGSPASDFPVAYLYKGERYCLSPEGLYPSSFTVGLTGQYYSTTTDERGCFNLSDDPCIQRVMVVHEDYFANITPDILVSTRMLRLEKWGRLEGNWFAGGKPAVGRTLEFKLKIGGVGPLYQVIFMSFT